MAKSDDKLAVMNLMASAAHKKVQPKDESEPDADDAAPKKPFPPKKGGFPPKKPAFGKK